MQHALRRLAAVGRGLVPALLSAAVACGGRGGGSSMDDAGGDARIVSAEGGALAPATQEPGAAATPATVAARSLRAEQFDAALIRSAGSGKLADSGGAAWRMIDVPSAGDAPLIASTPSGWLALSVRSQGDFESPSAWQSALYRSRDGVHWSRLALDADGDDLRLNGLAYGAGHYVMLGVRRGGLGVVWHSSDGEHWRQSEQPVRDTDVWSRLTFTEGHFFGFGFLYLGVSDTGEAWSVVPTTLVQGEAAAYGNGRYLLVGSGPMQTSPDGREWQAHDLNCGVSGECAIDAAHQRYHRHALFAEGSFFTEELTSLDGVSWQALPGRSPTAYIGDRFLGSLSLSTGLGVWWSGSGVGALRVLRPSRAAVTEAGRSLQSAGVFDREAPLPDTVDASFEDGMNCRAADCVLADGRLLLVPPLGTPALVDRVPRGADGVPLLSDRCPVSSVLFCDDYETRSGCVCHPEAPPHPASCGDVSRFRCAGEFVARPDEWHVAEVAQAGCSCDAVDPNQPAGLGSACGGGDTGSHGDTGLGPDAACLAPFECLRVDTPGAGGPLVERFMCTRRCAVDADCPRWEASGFCAGKVQLRCDAGACQPRDCG